MPPITLSGVPANQRLSTPAVRPVEATPKGEMSFGDYLSQALNQVEAVQKEAAHQGALLASGQVQDLSQVMIASEKATLSLQLAIQVRNKVLEAYQEIMRMPV